MPSSQELAYPAGFDYVAGSPHLKHPGLRRQVEASLVTEVARLRKAFGHCRVLEVGAGHGGFTNKLRQAGAQVTVTEMSQPSVARLRAEFSADPGVRVVHDRDGNWPSEVSDMFELVVAISVLHHIPDYLRAVDSFADRTVPGGSFISWQDPIWYDRLPRLTATFSRVAYLTWRIGQGNLRRGVSTQLRRWRGIYDETNVSDTSEYHVVRQGVDEAALISRLAAKYASVDVIRYWSTQGSTLQKAGVRLGLETTFALLARTRLPTVS